MTFCTGQSRPLRLKLLRESGASILSAAATSRTGSPAGWAPRIVALGYQALARQTDRAQLAAAGLVLFTIYVMTAKPLV